MTASPWLSDDEQAVWQDLLTVAITLPALLDRQLQRDSGISNFEYSILARLSMTDAVTMRLSELAEHCNSTQPRLSKVMDRFEARGWVFRRPDPDNGRYTLATLTESGRQKVTESAPAHVAEVKRLVFESLTPTQRRHLGTALSQVADIVRREFDRG